jgi:DNA polymerase-3 subunit chi
MRLEAALPKMLERVLERGDRAVSCWDPRGGWRPCRPSGPITTAASPPGRQDGFAAEQPIWLTVKDENPNGAQVLLLADGAESDRIADFRLCVELFDGGDEQAVAAARRRWAAYKSAGHALSYFQQTDAGGWEQKASA